MTELVVPDEHWHESWAASMQEFGEDYPHGSGLGDDAPAYDEAGCTVFAAWLRAAAVTPIREGWVRCTFFWITDGEDNAASRRTIERNGGIYEDSRKDKRRYWIEISG